MAKLFKSAFFILTIVLILLMAVTVSAQAVVNVYPQTIQSTENTLTVDVMVDDVSNLYGAEFRLKYDPAMLAVQDLNPQQNGLQIEAGSLLPSDKGFVVANKVDEATGEIVFAVTLLNPAPPVNGSGNLARVAFRVLQNAPTTLTVEHAKLVSADLQQIPNQLGNLAVGGESVVPVVAPLTQETINIPAASAGSSDFPWWIVAVVVMTLGIFVLGSLIILGGRRSKLTTLSPTTTQNSTKQQPALAPPQPAQSQQPRRSRPSAFNQPQTMPPDLAQEPHRTR